jgi:hypothetical protein
LLQDTAHVRSSGDLQQGLIDQSQLPIVEAPESSSTGNLIAQIGVMPSAVKVKALTHFIF